MDPVTSAIVGALSAGAISGLTDASKIAVTDAYQKLKSLLTRKFGSSSEVVQALEHLEAKPGSAERQEMLQKKMIAVDAGQDHEVLAAARQVLALANSQQTVVSKFTIQNNARVQGQTIGDHHTIMQRFEEGPKI
jgi:hypothetical protein